MPEVKRMRSAQSNAVLGVIALMLGTLYAATTRVPDDLKRVKFFDFGPPFRLYRIVSCSSEKSGASIERITLHRVDPDAGDEGRGGIRLDQ